MQLEIHILQSFPPANLNRDENGMPKSTVFGGRNRARISSQCQKRAARLFYHQYSDLDENLFAKRSKDWTTEIAKHLIKEEEIDREQAELVAACTISVFTEKKEAKGKKKKDSKKNSTTTEEKTDSEKTDKSDTSLFLGHAEVRSILDFLKTNWQQVVADISAKEPALSKLIIDGIKATVETKNKPGDVALFGRMMANLPSGKVDAAVQVAQAISVHALQQEFDFFTAVDELAPSNSSGADHLGEMGFNGSTYYRFAVVDDRQLVSNLGDNRELTTAVTKAFIDAFIESVPTGHQHQCAHHSRPAYVMLVVRKGQPISLVDAFEKPIRSSGGKSLLENAVFSLDNHWKDMAKMYGDKSIFVGLATVDRLADAVKNLKDKKYESVELLITAALEQLTGEK